MSESTHRMDPTFYRSPAEAIAAPTEQLAYVVAFDRAGVLPDALAILDVDETSGVYGTVVGWVELPTTGDELHRFRWNACSSALCKRATTWASGGWRAASCSCPACAAPASTSSTPSPAPAPPTICDSAGHVARCPFSRTDHVRR